MLPLLVSEVSCGNSNSLRNKTLDTSLRCCSGNLSVTNSSFGSTTPGFSKCTRAAVLSSEKEREIKFSMNHKLFKCYQQHVLKCNTEVTVLNSGRHSSCKSENTQRVHEYHLLLHLPRNKKKSFSSNRLS